MKPKIPTIRVDATPCVLNVGQVVTDGAITDPGVPHHVHEGEWVEVLPIMTVREVMQINRLQFAGDDASQLGENLSGLCQELSQRIIAWNWTDIMGEPLDQPYKRPDVLESLSSDELMWLMAATSQQESADARKKDSAQSEITSLEMEFNPVQSQ